MKNGPLAAIHITVEGITGGKHWSYGFVFEYANEESFYCRPQSVTEIPSVAATVRVAFLPPMSGLAAIEPKWEVGRIHVSVKGKPLKYYEIYVTKFINTPILLSGQS